MEWKARISGSTAVRPWPARTSSTMQPAKFARQRWSRRTTSSLNAHSSKPSGQALVGSQATSPRSRNYGTHSLHRTSQRRSCTPYYCFYAGKSGSTGTTLYFADCLTSACKESIKNWSCRIPMKEEAMVNSWRLALSM